MKKRKIFIILLVIIIALFAHMININKSKNEITISTEIATVAVEEEEETVETVSTISTTQMYTTTSVNMRDEPSLDGQIIETLYINTEVTTGEEQNGWTEIICEENIYYIKSEYLSEEKTEIPVTSRGGTASVEAAAAYTYLGTYKLTYYCSCTKCCGSGGGITASGVVPQEGVTIASNSIPMGTKVSIEGQVYEVQDRGGMASNVIDVYVSSHEKALNLGVKNNVPVYKVN